MKFYNWIEENQFLRLFCLMFIEKSNVNERWKDIMIEKWKDPET
jgi:hypothetical protein